MAVRDENTGMLTGGNTEIPPGENQGPTENLLSEENIFEMLSAIMVGTQGVPEGTSEEVLRLLEGRQIDTQAQLEAAVNQVIANAYEEAQGIVDTMVDNPEALADIEDPGPLVTAVLENGAMQFAGVTPTTPITTAAGGEVVIQGGAGVTVDVGQVIEAGGQIFGEGGILDAIKGYIPGISLPDWMPSAGVIFLPTIGEIVNTVNDIVVNSDISSAIEEGDIGEILNDIGEIVAGAGSAAVDVISEQVNELLGQIQGVITDPTKAGTVIGGIIGTAFPNIPSWLPPLITDPRVRSAVSSVLTQEYDADPNLFAEEEIVDINEDDTTLIDDTIKADVKFPEEPEPEPEAEEDEVIVQDTVKGGSQMGTDPVGDPIEEFIEPEPEPEPAPQPEPQPEPEPEVEEEDESIVENLFSDVIGQTEANILQAIADAGYATPQDVIDAISEAGLLTAENLATTLANAGFATPEDIGTALANAGFATPQDIADALSAAGFATPEDLATALSNAGYTTPEDLVTALSNAGFATPEDIATALTNAGLATPQDIADAFDAAGLATPQDVIDAISAAGLATPQDVADALEAFGFTDAQLQQIAGALPEGLTLDQLNTALSDALAGIATGTDLETATTTITDAIAGLGFATPQDVRDALSEFGFTDAQLEQIVNALPEGLSTSDLADALAGVVVGEDLDAAVTTITDAIGGLDIASPDDIRNILSEYGFTDAQLQQIIGALPEGLSLSDVTGALETALSGIALGTDLDTATSTITDAIGGLAFATPDDVANALAQFGFTDDQLAQIAGVIPEGLSIADLNDALSSALSGIALGTDLDTATNTITDAIGGLDFATAQDIQDALTGFNFTESQLNQISDLLPDNLTQAQVQDLLTTSLSGVSTQEGVDEAFATLTTNLSASLGGLEAGQEEILTGQEGLFGGQQDILTGVGEESQRLEDIIMSSTGLLAAIGAGGLGGGAPARPRPQPYRPYMEKLDYAPGMVEVLKPQQQVDYNKEVDRLLTMGMGGRKQGMLV